MWYTHHRAPGSITERKHTQGWGPGGDSEDGKASRGKSAAGSLCRPCRGEDTEPWEDALGGWRCGSGGLGVVSEGKAAVSS